MLKLIVVGMLVIASACSFKKKDENLSGSVQVQIPFSIDGQYGLRILELLTLQDLPKLSGGAAKFLMDPDSGAGILTGRAPNFRYIRNDDGVVIPTDDLSLQLVTVYAHFERLQILDEQVGAKGVLTYPRVVAVNTQIKKSDGSLDSDNALYSGKYDALLMVPYTQNFLPVMANGGVVAHEHFHALFHKLVIEPMSGKYPDLEKDKGLHTKYHATLLRGINEGFADVWGWIYSGDTNFVHRSLPKLGADRDLDADNVFENIKSTSWIRNEVRFETDPEAMVATAYVVGHHIARVIKNFATFYRERKGIEQSQARVLVGEYLLKALPLLKQKVLNLKEGQFLSPMAALDAFSANVPDLSNEECHYFAKRADLGDQTRAREERCQKLP
jgi:hypothetical protein